MTNLKQDENFYRCLNERICSSCNNQQEIYIFKKRAAEFLSNINTYVNDLLHLENNKFEKL